MVSIKRQRLSAPPYQICPDHVHFRNFSFSVEEWPLEVCRIDLNIELRLLHKIVR
jgi:hypothetical protein